MNDLTHDLRRLFFWLCWPFLYVYFRSQPRSRVLLYTKNNRVLLVQGHWKQLFDDGGYGLPGGGISRRESPTAGAVRELAEELDFIVDSGALEMLSQETVREHGLRYNAFFYRLQVSETLPLALENEIVNAQWFDMDDLPKTLKPEVVQAVRNWPTPNDFVTM